MKKKILGGALLIAGAKEDHDSGLVDFLETLARIELIKKYESGELTLKKLNEIW